MRTYSAKPAEARAAAKWWVIDAKDQPLGRVATRIATVLTGKHKPTYTAHVDTGDFVVVINADKVKVTGRKTTQKMYYHHTGYPGSLRSESFEHIIVRRPEIPITKAVKGMLPKNVLARHMLGKLKVYASAEHPHAAQKPEPLPIA